MQDAGLIPGPGTSPGEGNATHSSIFAWEIPWTEEPGGLQSMGSKKSQTQLNDSTTAAKHDIAHPDKGIFPI